MTAEGRSTREMALGVIAAGFENDAIGTLPPFGGYLLFARNGTSAAAVRAVTDELRAHAPQTPPPLIAIDQEGGRVARIRDGIETIPPMMALGAASDLELTGRAAEQTAFDLRRAGCTFDFSPVLDLAVDSRNTVIGNRSFGADPEAVARLGQRFAGGLRSGGLTPCYKHFPGHGSTEIDSHFGLPFVEIDEATLRARDLIPFVRVAPAASAIMGAHVVARAFDPENPASLSPRIAALLRDELGFRGAYVTDCLEMGAVSGSAGDNVAVRALLAGADFLLFSHNASLALEAVRAIVDAVERGVLPEQRLREAYARVTSLRAAAPEPLPLTLSSPHPGVGREIAHRAITLVRGFPHADPTASFAVQFGEPAERLAREAPVVMDTLLDLEPEDGAVTGAIDAIARSGRRPIVLTRRAHLYPRQAAAAERIVERFPDAVVVSTLEPFDVACFPSARHVLAAYGDDSASTGGLADVLFSGIMPQGRLPVAVGDQIARA